MHHQVVVVEIVRGVDELRVREAEREQRRRQSATTAPTVMSQPPARPSTA
jgi:hypothetical protein